MVHRLCSRRVSRPCFLLCVTREASGRIGVCSTSPFLNLLWILILRPSSASTVLKLFLVHMDPLCNLLHCWPHADLTRVPFLLTLIPFLSFLALGSLISSRPPTMMSTLSVQKASTPLSSVPRRDCLLWCRTSILHMFLASHFAASVLSNPA